MDTTAMITGVLAVIVRPWLWGTALRFLLRASPSGWWRRAPFLPVPSPEYLDFRYSTAYGKQGRPRARDLVAYLEWCRSAAA